MSHTRKNISVIFTAARLSALDDRSAGRFRGRVGQVIAHESTGKHVSVEFPLDGERRPERLERVPLEYLEVVHAHSGAPAPSPAHSPHANTARTQHSARSKRDT
jgi:hypothetical protein